MGLAPLVLALALGRCECPQVPEPPPGIPDGPVSWSYIAVGADGAQGRARGFDGAVPVGASIEVLDGAELLGVASPDSRGRFDLAFRPPEAAKVTLRVTLAEAEAEPLSLEFPLKDMQQALDAAVNPRLGATGSMPNHLALVPALASADDVPVLIVNSGDNNVDNLGLSSGRRLLQPLSLPAQSGSGGPRPAQPYAVAVLDQRAAVTRFGQSAVTLFNAATGAVLAEIQETQAVALPQPFTPATPVDADGDGTPESVVTAILPRGFEGLAFAGSRLFVAAANVLRTTAPVVYAPGLLLAYEVGATSLSRPAAPRVFTAFENPQFVLGLGDAVAVVESGVLEQTAQGWQATRDGGVELFDAATLQRRWQANLGRLAPGAVALSPDGQSLYVSSMLKPEIYKLDVASGQILRGASDPIRLFSASEVQSLFGLEAHPMGLLFATCFNSDQVFVVDTANDSVSPWPFVKPLQVGEGGQAFAGAQALALRPGRNGVDFRGADLAVLLNLAARVATVDTRFVMGP
ncbi:MAG: hypothetical protein ABIJ09_24740 [Pseudomonadota bacterium]